jgi:class 3 adenylate cyclase
MKCPTCGTDNPANARFCIQCGAPLPRVCASCGAVNPAGARFCNQCGAPLASAPLAAAVTPAASATSAGGGRTEVPPTLPVASTATRGRGRRAREEAPSNATTGASGRPRSAATDEAASVAASNGHGAGEEHAEERRVVTILFADLTSSTALADGMDAEDVRSLLSAFFATMARQIHRHGGTVEKYIGDAVMAVFGLPVAHEDDPVRAIRAALDMQRALRQFNEARLASDPSVPELEMRIGVNTGEVVAASGAGEGRDFLITGDAVNVAARLQQAAAPGSIVVGPRTYRATSGAVEYRSLPPLTLRGKPRPVRVWEAVAVIDAGSAPAPRPRGVRGLYAPLVGRDVELDLLRSIYSRVANERRPHLVTIIGAPGVGKTRLAREFLSVTAAWTEAEGAPTPDVLEGRCPPYGEGITYWPLAEMLRTHCKFSALEAPETARAKVLAWVRELLQAASRPEDPELIAAYLGQTIGIESRERRRALLPSDAQQFQEGLLRAWRVFFEALANAQPLIVLVDDIHWADDTLLDLLEYVAARARAVPLLLLCPARPELLEKRPDWGGGKRNYVILGLEALSARDAERLVQALLPGDGVPESLRRGILMKAEGNPFYVEEIVRMLVDRGILIHQEPGGGWGVAPEWEDSPELSDPDIPDTVQGVLAARLDLLPEQERDVLQHAAVIGRFFWADALRNLHPQLGIEEFEGVLATLLAKDLIRESERPDTLAAPAGERVYTFNHTLTREVTYAAIPRARRAHEHQRVAEWLERLAEGREAEFADLLAQHYRQFYVQANLTRSRNAARRQAVRAKVVHYLALAGDQAVARHAAGKAERYFSDALELLAEDALAEDVPERVTLYSKRGDAHWLQLDGDSAWADYREALRLWTAFSGYMVDSAADGAAAAALSTMAAPVAADGAPAALAELQVPADGQLVLPLDWRARGMRLYRQLVQLPTRYPMVFQAPPSHEDLLEYLREGLRLVEEFGQRDTLEGAELLTAKAFFWWSWPEQRTERELLDALRSAREAVRIAEALDQPHVASEALDALGSIQAVITDLRGNVESQIRRLHWAHRIDDTYELLDIYTTACMAHALVAEYAHGVEQGQLALELAQSAEAPPFLAQALRTMTIAQFEWDHWPEAIRAAKQLQTASAGLNLLHSDSHRWALLDWAIVLARLGDQDGSDAVARRVSELPERTEVQLVGLARARLALARGAVKEARQLLLSSLEAKAGRMVLPALLAELAELGARTGERELYDRFGPQALELGWRSGARKALGQATRARGVVAIADGRWDDGLADLQTALQRFQEFGTIWEEARTRYALAGLYRRRNAEGDEALARDELTRAQALFEALRSVRDIARVRAALAGGEVRVP